MYRSKCHWQSENVSPCGLQENELNCPTELLNSTSFQKTHQSALQVQQKAEAMLQANHYDMDMIRECAEKVASHWQQLMLKMEDRLKLVNASVAFYKTSEQVQKCFLICQLWLILHCGIKQRYLEDLFNWIWLYLLIFTYLSPKMQKANYFLSCLRNTNHMFLNKQYTNCANY